MKELFQPLWNIFMRNQKLETELVYTSAKCNTLRQCGVITDPPAVYTHSAWRLIYSPQGNNCQN